MSLTPTYFTHGKVIAESGDIAVYEFEGVRYLNRGPGLNLWADSNEITELKDQIGNKPRGDYLEIGLGLGVASKLILSSPRVFSLTTVEINENVLETYRQLNPEIDLKHHVIHGSGEDFLLTTSDRFDFVFLDFYSLIDEDTLTEIEQCVKLSKRVLRKDGEIMGWLDIYTPEKFEKEFFELFK